jgi:hypothetical protein
MSPCRPKYPITSCGPILFSTEVVEKLQCICDKLSGSSGDGGSADSVAGRKLLTQSGHGFGLAGALVPVRPGPSVGQYQLAGYTSDEDVASFVALIVDVDTFYLLAPGFHTVPSHGYDISFLYSGAVGATFVKTTLVPENAYIQNAFTVQDSDVIFINLEEAIPPFSACCDVQTKTSHGFVAGNIIAPDGVSWVKATASSEGAVIVLKVVDANTFIIGLTGCLTALSGIIRGKSYVVVPDSQVPGIPAGSLIDRENLLESDLVLPVGASPTNGCLLINMSPAHLCACTSVGGGGVEDTTPPTITSLAIPSTGNSIIVTFSEGVLPATGISGFSVEVDAVLNVITSTVRTSSNTMVLTLTDTVLVGETVTLSYAAGNVTDSATNDLADVTDAAVANGSIQTGGISSFFFDEQFSAGAHDESYTDLLNPLGSNVSYINTPGLAPLSDYRLEYKELVGATDSLSYRADATILSPTARIEFEAYVGLIGGVTSCSDVVSFSRTVAGSQAGLKALFGTTGGGWSARLMNNGAGETLDISYTDVNVPVSNKWYKLTGHIQMSSAAGVADGELTFVVQPLQGTLASTNGTADGAPVVNQVITGITTHAVVAVAPFNFIHASGGYMGRPPGAVGSWGLAYGGLRLNV